MEKMNFPQAHKNEMELSDKVPGGIPKTTLSGMAAGDTTATMKEPTFKPDLDLCVATNNIPEMKNR